MLAFAGEIVKHIKCLALQDNHHAFLIAATAETCHPYISDFLASESFTLAIVMYNFFLIHFVHMQDSGT